MFTHSTDGRVDFRCLCGFQAAGRVTVAKPNGQPYRTEFMACNQCHALFHWPGDDPRSPSAPETHSAGPDISYEPLLSPEKMAELDAAVARAQRKRARRR
jgi:hypothetical protein